MSSNNLSYPVVAGVDGTGDGITAAEFGARLASSMGRSLVLLHAYRASAAINPLLPLATRGTVGVGPSAAAHGSFLTEDNLDVMCWAGRKALDDAESRVIEVRPGLHVVKRLVMGFPSSRLVAASSEAVAVVVARSHENRFERVFAGSTSQDVAAHANCPTVVVPSEWSARQSLHRIVVGVEGSWVATEALTFAFQEAVLTGSELVAVHAFGSAVPKGGGSGELSSSASRRRAAHQRAVSEIIAGWSEFYPEVKVSVDVVSASPTDALLAAAAEADLVVVSAHRRGGFGAPAIGSVARALVARAGCPVVVVRFDPCKHRDAQGEWQRVESIAMPFY